MDGTVAAGTALTGRPAPALTRPGSASRRRDGGDGKPGSERMASGRFGSVEGRLPRQAQLRPRRIGAGPALLRARFAFGMEIAGRGRRRTGRHRRSNRVGGNVSPMRRSGSASRRSGCRGGPGIAEPDPARYQATEDAFGNKAGLGMRTRRRRSLRRRCPGNCTRGSSTCIRKRWRAAGPGAWPSSWR